MEEGRGAEGTARATAYEGSSYDTVRNSRTHQFDYSAPTTGEGESCNALLTPSLSQPGKKIPSSKLQGSACEQYIFRSCDIFLYCYT